VARSREHEKIFSINFVHIKRYIFLTIFGDVEKYYLTQSNILPCHQGIHVALPHGIQ
jgi:hypothetical protein